ncbi:hypothetical protein CYLTODRAFT_402650 [Cylindrobasidium torrendii FP15055 ss-10]|uniref:Peptidase S1 domain-containing protein n=1 Tax=Cylindrobasidium torrendii FP15055 ss-10 TaxID=1314674 RepID=A0A0D7AZM9_9AGAR|nr:hypothetical protein CYLTODRAFT_402650 [Cylindrobasidium torrendii FP15055 ss-10]
MFVSPEIAGAYKDLAVSEAASVDFNPAERTASSVEDDLTRLTSFYPDAITDFYGSGAPCVFKKGPKWPVADGSSPMLFRAARPIHGHPIQPSWAETARTMGAVLNSLQVQWNTLDPLAYANAGMAELICEFVVIIGVRPKSLLFGDAVAAANALHGILETAGYPGIEVAFVESSYRLHYKLMSFEPSSKCNHLRKPFTATPGLSIAHLHRGEHFEGSASVFFRLSSDPADKRIGLLTCAHVARPRQLFPNQTFNRRHDYHPRENILFLGNESYEQAVKNIMIFIGTEVSKIASRVSILSNGDEGGVRFEFDKGHDEELVALVDAVKNKIEEADKLHSKVTKFFTTYESRVIGFVLHSSKIKVGAGDFNYDWSMIQLDENKIDLADFKGNKLFVGGNKTKEDWEKYMFPQPDDLRGFSTPEDMLLTLKDYVPEAEMRNPQDLDVHGVKTLLAVKNGSATGTTFGRVNGLESVTRAGYADHRIALEYVVCAYDTQTGKNERFSNRGDSGSMVVGRDGRLIGLLTGGGSRDKSYITPYYMLKDAITQEFPGAHILDLDAE